MIDTVTPHEHARGFAAQYAGVFTTLTTYLEVRVSDGRSALLADLEALLRQSGPLPTYSEYRRQQSSQRQHGAGLPDGQTRERVLLDGAVRGLNARIISGGLFTDDAEAAALHTYVQQLSAFILGAGDFPGLLDLPQGVPQ